MYQWNKIESPDIDSHIHIQLFFDKETKQVNKTMITLQQMMLEQVEIHKQKEKSRQRLNTFHKMKLHFYGSSQLFSQNKPFHHSL